MESMWGMISRLLQDALVGEVGRCCILGVGIMNGTPHLEMYWYDAFFDSGGGKGW